MSRPPSRQPHNPAMNSAPRIPLGQQAAQMLEMGEAMEPGIAPALESHLDREVFEARQEGRDFLSPVDLSALPGQTLGEQSGQKEGEYVQTPLGNIPAELAESLKKWAMDSNGPAISPSDAAIAGQSVSAMQDAITTQKRLEREKRYQVMITARETDRGEISGSLNGVPYTVPVGVSVSLPYSLVSLMVDLGRLAPPPDCPELFASAINAGSLSATTEMARLTKTNPNGFHHGDSADAALAAQLESMTQLNIQQQAGRALPANLRHFQAPPALTFGGKAL